MKILREISFWNGFGIQDIKCVIILEVILIIESGIDSQSSDFCKKIQNLHIKVFLGIPIKNSDYFFGCFILL